MFWHEEIDGLRDADPHLAGMDLPAAAEVLRLHGFKDLSGVAGVDGVRTLWVDRAPQSELARLGALAPELDTLVVGGQQVTELGYLRGVGAPSTVVLYHHTKIERLDGIDVLGSVRSLTLDHFPRVHDLGPLSALTNLRHLGLSTLFSRAANGNGQLVDSLAPLQRLRSLEKLVCFSVVARDGDLSPLYGLPRLADVEIPFVYSTEQVARLAGVLGYDAERWPPVVEITGWSGPSRCRICGSADEVLLIGVRRRKYACRHCDAERVERHIAAFEAWRAEGAAAA